MRIKVYVINMVGSQPALDTLKSKTPTMPHCSTQTYRDPVPAGVGECEDCAQHTLCTSPSMLGD